jgi:hypothetical protein
MVDQSVLRARAYGRKGDYQMVADWWAVHRDGDMFVETILPPTGVIIELNGEPVGALWCYQALGIGVGFVEFPVTRPGLSMREAGVVLATAVDAIAAIVKPDGYNLLRCSTMPAIASRLERLGWRVEAKGRTNLMRRID